MKQVRYFIYLIQEEQTLEVERDEKGRPLRQARKNAVNLKFILESENNENDVSTSSVKKDTRKRRRSEIDDDNDVEEWASGIISYHKELNNNSKNRSVTIGFNSLTSYY